MKKNKIAFFAFLVLFLHTSLFATDLTFRVTPGVGFPLDDKYDTSFNGTVQADLDLFGFLTVGLEGTLATPAITALQQQSFFYGGGLGLGFYYYPLSRLYIGLGIGTGIYQFYTNEVPSEASDSQNSADSSEGKKFADFYYRAYGELGFRFSPSLTLSANTSYTNYLLYNNPDNMTSQMSVGLGVRYSIPLGNKNSSGFIVTVDQFDSAYPVFMSAYKSCPLANLKLRNNTGAEVKNIRVSLRAGKYSASTYESALIPRINKYAEKTISLYADFSSQILDFTEDGKILCELVIEYDFLGKKYTNVQNIVLSVYNRNAFSWLDSTALSCFISPDTPEILEVAKYIAGVARNNFYTGMNRNIQMAAAMMEALRIGGIKYLKGNTPYTEYHLSEKLDYIQYPLQTLNNLGGDYDELGILLASLLESVGVPTGYMALDDDFILLVSTQTSPTSAENLFANPKGTISDDSLFFGLSMASFNEGFIKSRKNAAKKIQKALEDENSSAEYTNVHAAWEVYSPAIFSGNGSYFDKPSSAQITDRCVTAIKDYINADLTVVLDRARKSGDSNKIGIALMRMGRYDEAVAELKKDNSNKAQNNLATVYLILKNYNAAAATYKKVLAKDPQNKIALKGLENANAKLGL